MPVTGVTSEDQRFIDWCRSIWQAIKDEYETVRGLGSLKVYKQYNPEWLPPLLPKIVAKESGGTLLDAATELLSGGVMTHPFENANHRSFINSACIYLEANGVRLPEFDPRDEKARWVAECNLYINRSKGIRAKLFDYLEWDPSRVVRVAATHRRATSEWLGVQLSAQSSISSVAGIRSIRTLIAAAESAG
ncbi:MAG TPA: hypothetical protein VI893_05555 [Thermoplasmata archaeon]|nr:hypothetical protein [Thermoplasmata archaeon]